jgi:hypothetical protein
MLLLANLELYALLSIVYALFTTSFIIKASPLVPSRYKSAPPRKFLLFSTAHINYFYLAQPRQLRPHSPEMSDLSNVAESSMNRSEPNGYQRMHKHYNILPFDEMEPYEDSINRFFTKNRAAKDTINHPGKLMKHCNC